jgi:hypothetical protein
MVVLWEYARCGPHPTPTFLPALNATGLVRGPEMGLPVDLTNLTKFALHYTSDSEVPNGPVAYRPCRALGS